MTREDEILEKVTGKTVEYLKANFITYEQAIIAMLKAQGKRVPRPKQETTSHKNEQCPCKDPTTHDKPWCLGCDYKREYLRKNKTDERKATGAV